MKLTNTEKELVKFLVKRELLSVKEEGEDIRPTIGFLAAEEKYELVLEALLKKL